MLITQLKATVALIILFLAIAIAAKTIGTLQPPNPALRGFIEGCEDQPQPCWYGIVPAVTSVEKAKQKLKEHGFSLVDQSSMHLEYSEPPSDCSIILGIQTADKVNIQTNITSISFYLCPNLYVGDMMGLYGDQERYQNGITFIDGSATGTTFDIIRLNSWIISPLEKLTVFILKSSYDFECPRYKWHGFVLKWRYRQLEPQFAQC
jgi:hypothetical protein